MGIALYIHIPFCKSKCMYCDFCSYSGKEDAMMEYTRALCDEILLMALDKSIDTIFIGGGTPTYLSLEAWELIEKTLKRLKIKKDAEFTVECNPGTVDGKKLEILKRIGVNRISIGLQAYQDKLLKAIGRIHTVQDFVESYKLIRSYGFKNINVDVMFGLPNQSIGDLRHTLQSLVEMAPEHISCYSLIVEEGTPFGILLSKGSLSLPSEEEEREMYEYAQAFLSEKGYRQYEISNYSKEGYECRHNIVYWKLKEYVGCGAGAHSYAGGIRYSNEENIKTYIEFVKKIGISTVESRQNTIQDDMEEFMFMGLRMLEGIKEGEFFKRFGIELLEVYGSVIEKYTKLELLKKSAGHIYLTYEGIQLSNSIMSDFILDKD